MTITTIKHAKEKPFFYFYKDVHQINLNYNSDQPNLFNATTSNVLIHKEKTIEFISDVEKIFISPHFNFYIFHNDCVGVLFKNIDLLKNCQLVIDESFVLNKGNNIFYNFFIKNLKELEIKYEVINCDKDTVIHANNFYILKKMNTGEINSAKIIFNIYKKYIKNLKDLPYKNVYLARKDDRLGFNNKIIEYFKNKNFEIIFSEDFKDFEEQINYFYSVKTLISESGAGLYNSIFMQEKTNIVELLDLQKIKTPSLNNKITEQIHHFHHLTSFQKNQNYTSIPNVNNDYNEIIDSFEKCFA